MTGTATVGTIYGLVDPRDGKPRYIGQTRQRLAVRRLGKYAAGRDRWHRSRSHPGL